MKRGAAATCALLAMFLLGTRAALGKHITPPKSFQHELRPIGEIDHWLIEPFDVAAWLERDRKRGDEPGPFRVAFALPLDLDPGGAGTWEPLADGGRVWRVRVSSPGAVFLSFKFSDFELPSDAELHFVSAFRDYHDGPYTRRHNRATRRFGAPMVPGDSAVIELYVPAGAGPTSLRLESISHGFRDVMGMGSVPARGSPAAALEPAWRSFAPRAPGGAFDCQRDINCPEGAPYQDLKRAVAEGYDGQFICSGQLVNNVRQDNRYLYLTAAHCEWWIDPSTMAYYWNYENSGCGTNDAPLRFSTGSVDLYHDTASDINLLELDGTDLETRYDIYFTGWNRDAAAPASGATISFPSDKPKQIAIEDDPITDCATAGCSGGFGANFWRVEGWDVGVTEAGSSGAALLDQDALLVGVLTGGVGTNCNNFAWDEYAQIHPQWPDLQPFLDPDTTGAVWLPGKDHDDVPIVPVGSAWGGAILVGLVLLTGGRATRRMARCRADRRGK